MSGWNSRFLYADCHTYIPIEAFYRCCSIRKPANEGLPVYGGFIIFGTASVLFFKWFGAEERAQRRARAGST